MSELEFLEPHAAPAMLRHAGDHAAASAHGAQVLSWCCHGKERLYLSPRAEFAPGKAIRGGVPVIFPQFSGRGPGLRHGFARLGAWEYLSSGDPAKARFALCDSASSRRFWPHPFRAEIAVDLAPHCLSITLQIANTGREPLAFTAALHTYLRVDDAASVHLLGLEGRHYLDSTQGGVAARQPYEPLRFHAETDRIYPDVAGPLHLVEGRNSLQIDQTGFQEVVVWNPGADGAARTADLGPGEHTRFVCVEAAQVVRPVELAPGDTWQGRQVLTVVGTRDHSPA